MIRPIQSFVFLTACALAPLAPHATANDSPPVEPARPIAVEDYRETVDLILRSSLSQGQAYTRLAGLCAEAPHRLSGTPGAARAVAWMKAEMEREGFENVRLEDCMVPHWERGDIEELVLLDEAGAPTDLALPILALGGSIATPEAGLTAGVIEVRDFEELAARADEALGKIVFFNRPMDPELFSTGSAYGGAVNQRSRGAIEAAKAGGIAAVVRSMTTRLDDFPHTGAMHYADDVERVPTVAVSTLGANRLSELIAAGAAPQLRLKLACQWFEDAPSHNVVGELVGSEFPDEVIVVGGHLDGWDVGQGAHDDGGGCCQAFEVVRLLKALDLRPRRTIRVVLFMNEESGTRGARAYHDTHEGEMPDHILALESDSGSFSPRGFTGNANPEALVILREIVALMEHAGIYKMDPGYGGVDISPMIKHGVINVGLRPDPHRYFDLHHSNRDTMDQVSDREINLGAGAIAALLFVVADLPERLPRNPSKEDPAGAGH